MLDLPAISALTFDCYGTLVDWETGILEAVKGVLAGRGVRPPGDDELLRLFADLEAEQEAADYQPYRDVLACVMIGIADRCGIKSLGESEQDELAESLERWPVFPDTAPFLRRALQRYTLAVCSNVDEDLFSATRRALGAPLNWAVTAEYCRSYKPDPRHFRVALALLDLPPHRVLHVAESRRHDIEPAKKMGFQTVWVNRHKGRAGPSASGSSDAVPDLEVGGLEELAGVLGLESFQGGRV